ncbi:ATP-binding protein [Streptomyces sp. GSL17-111]|uniref:ATP-binding protein n=1 Tax=Streptomyces sp. GSL17-111 TaxID=3121596 RepID=UPI0030F42D36
MPDAVLRRAETPVLVGRTGELHALLDALTHPPAVVLVEGEAGIGKTRLVREALGHVSVRGRTVLTGGCHPLREPFPYGPVFELLRRLEGRLPAELNPVCGALRPYLPELAEGLPPAPEPLADQRVDQHRLFRAVRALLEDVGGGVIVVEDLHWADEGTRDLVRFLVDDPPEGLSTVLSYRREELPGTGLPLGRAYRQPPGTTAVLVPLGPLDVTGVRSMTAALTGTADVPAALAEALHAHTAGIPFVLEEVVRALPEGAGTTGRLAELGVPTRLHEAMADRMALLSPVAAACVRASATLRVPAGEELIAAVAGAGPAEAGTALRDALGAGVLHELGPDRYGFRHTLAQQAVYHSVPGPARRALHRRAVRALESAEPRPLVQLAYHARESGQPDLWRRYGEAAAETAQRMGDLALAVELLEGLLSDEHLAALERARLATRLSRVAVNTVSHRRAAALLRRIVHDDRLPDGLRGEIRLNLGLLLHNQGGEYEQGRADTEVAVEELRERPSLAARGMAALALPSWSGQPYRVYERWIERAEELLGADAEGWLRAAVRGNHLALRVSRGDPAVWPEAEELLRSAGQGDAQQRVHVARTCGNLADYAAWLGLDGPAQRFRREAERLATEYGATFVEGIAVGTGLRLDWYGGRWEGLTERARRVLEGHLGVAAVAADAQLVLGQLALARGEWEEATARLDAAGVADPDNAPAPVLASASGAAVRLLAARGGLNAACATADRALARLRRKDIWAWGAELVPMAVTAYARAGRLDEAESVTCEFAAGVAEREAPAGHAAVHVCRGVLATAARRHGSAALAFEEARAAYAALPRPYPAARAAEAAARAALAPGVPDGRDPAEAARRLGAVAEEFTALGATRDAARCRRVLRGTGVVTPSRRGRRGYGDALSPREREVARLVALGHTNREIAEVLFLSPRTIEQHVAKVLRKLGVASRAEVPAED